MKRTKEEHFHYWFSRSGDELAKLSDFLEEQGAPKEDIEEIESFITKLQKWKNESQLTTPFTSDNE